MNAAGTNAHRCGWSVHRSESTASIAQAAAKASSTEPVMTCSCAASERADDEHDGPDESADEGTGHDAADVTPGGRGLDADDRQAARLGATVVSGAVLDVLAMTGLLSVGSQARLGLSCHSRPKAVAATSGTTPQIPPEGRRYWTSGA